DISADAVKTGMLGDSATIGTVAAELERDGRGIPLVLDPVMVAKGGSRLLAEEAVAALKRRLLPLATVVTPNVPEAEVLAGAKVRDLEGMRAAAAAILALGVPAVLLKGGHLPGERLYDLLATPAGMEVFEIGKGHGPLDHGVTVDPARVEALGR
ncbi:MAG: bifunctional hydroxymethylpyrimidine kinase/phosphomethylpyrimidine kinase, partial [Roseomonas mucosa]|nr:bifunctional hydroxymethylpyrimidine kinase/phosphomethylpyrimidine kinase [Roseomonas mucosa]